jgi:uncharacterized protein YbjT (DUF2867 family)
MATTIKSTETTILVTGATGTVGSEVVRQLTSQSSFPSSGTRVRAAVHSQNKADKFRHENRAVEIVNMELQQSRNRC